MNSPLSKIFKSALTNLDAILFAFLSFFLIKYFLLSPDFDQHVLFTINYTCPIAPEFNQPHFLLFRTISLLTFRSCHYNTVMLAFQIVVSFFIGVKYLIVKGKIKEALNQPLNLTSYAVAVFFTVFLSIFITIPNYQFINKHWLYTSVPNGNCWHNSTFLVTLPFAILLFYKGFELINNPTTRNIVVGILLVFVNVFCKPVYFLSFLPVFFLFTLYYNRLDKKFFMSSIPLFFGIFCLAYQLFFASRDIYSGGERGISFDFFAVFGINYPSIWIFTLSLFFVFAFPIVFFLLNPQGMKEKEIVFAFLTTFLSLMISIMFAESGDRLSAANFVWGLATSINILFLVTTIQLIKKYKDTKFDVKFYLPFVVLCLHYLAGVAYILKIIVKGWYM